MINIRALRAGQGDCFILTYGNGIKNRYIIIDGGMGKECFQQLREFINSIKKNGDSIELLILTHFDNDHIDGFIQILKDKSIDFSVIKEIWFNYGTKLSEYLKTQKQLQIYVDELSKQTSKEQGKDLYEKIKINHIELNPIIKELDVYEMFGAKITILSPSIEQLKALVNEIGSDIGKVSSLENNDLSKITASSKSDYSHEIKELPLKEYSEKGVSVANKSSIAFIFEYESKRIMFLGDAVSSQIVSALSNLGYSKENPLKLNYCKIAHHGSSHNTSFELLELLDCENYIISSNWTQNRPSKTCLSRIVVSNAYKPVNLFFNYKYKEIFTTKEKQQFNISLNVICDSGINL